MRSGGPAPGEPARPRLCMVVHAYYPLGEPRVQREARAATEAGYDVTVLCLREPGTARAERVDGATVRRHAVRHVRGAGLLRIVFEYVTFTALATLTLARATLRRPFDVVQVHTPPDFLVVAGLPAKLRGARLILDIHDLSSHIYGARFEGRTAALVARVLRLVERLACAAADHVITVHEPYRAELSAHAVAAGKVSVVMNAVDEAVMGGIERRRVATVPGDGFVLGYHGTLTDWYGVALVLEAMHELDGELPGSRAVVLGDGDALPRLRRLAGELGLGGRVEFSGRYLPIEEALRRVARANCGVIPNRPSRLNRFALSSKLFEYVELRIPVVVARLPTLAGHFSENEVTFFEPGDARSLARAIAWVAEHPEEAAAKAERAALRAERYSWQRQKSRYLALLRA